MYLLYDLVLMLACPILIPYALFKGVGYGPFGQGLGERFGCYARRRLEVLRGKKVIWVHAVSVGEVRAALPLLQALKADYPAAAVVLSSMTFTGHALARETRAADLCIFFPVDLSWVMRRVIRSLAVNLIIVVETEIWPNFLRQARRAGVPVVLVNGRISDKSFPRYHALRRLLRPLLQGVAAFCMQSNTDAQRIETLGAEPERVHVTGNLKFDLQGDIPDAATVAGLKDRYRLPADQLIWVAGSTRPGEEEILVEVYRKLVADGLGVVLVVVPRHVERCRALTAMFEREHIPCVVRSSLERSTPVLQPGAVLLVDTIGEMLDLYATADLVFVGGSLVPLGGHNILEPALLGKPVLFGPHMQNFKEISRLLLSAQGGLQVADQHELAGRAGELLMDAEARRVMGEQGQALLRRHVGATRRTMAIIASLSGAAT